MSAQKQLQSTNFVEIFQKIDKLIEMVELVKKAYIISKNNFKNKKFFFRSLETQNRYRTKLNSVRDIMVGLKNKPRDMKLIISTAFQTLDELEIVVVEQFKMFQERNVSYADSVSNAKEVK